MASMLYLHETACFSTHKTAPYLLQHKVWWKKKRETKKEMSSFPTQSFHFSCTDIGVALDCIIKLDESLSNLLRFFPLITITVNQYTARVYRPHYRLQHRETKCACSNTNAGPRILPHVFIFCLISVETLPD